MSKKMNDHCVIGLHCAGGVGRTWLDSEAAAIEHGQELVHLYGQKAGTKLAVVKVVKIIEVPRPRATVRKPEAGDMP